MRNRALSDVKAGRIKVLVVAYQHWRPELYNKKTIYRQLQGVKNTNCAAQRSRSGIVVEHSLTDQQGLESVGLSV